MFFLTILQFQIPFNSTFNSSLSYVPSCYLSVSGTALIINCEFQIAFVKLHQFQMPLIKLLQFQIPLFKLLQFQIPLFKLLQFQIPLIKVHQFQVPFIMVLQSSEFPIFRFCQLKLPGTCCLNCMCSVIYLFLSLPFSALCRLKMLLAEYSLPQLLHFMVIDSNAELPYKETGWGWGEVDGSVDSWCCCCGGCLPVLLCCYLLWRRPWVSTIVVVNSNDSCCQWWKIVVRADSIALRPRRIL